MNGAMFPATMALLLAGLIVAGVPVSAGAQSVDLGASVESLLDYARVRNPELATTFYQVGPGHTREALARFLGRADIKGLFRPGLPPEQLAIHLLNCIMRE